MQQEVAELAALRVANSVGLRCAMAAIFRGPWWTWRVGTGPKKSSYKGRTPLAGVQKHKLLVYFRTFLGLRPHDCPMEYFQSRWGNKNEEQ